MPVINFQGGKLNAAQKKELIERFTEVAVEVTKAPAQFFSVIIQEFEDDNLGSGGKTVSQIKSEMQKK